MQWKTLQTQTAYKSVQCYLLADSKF